MRKSPVLCTGDFLCRFGRIMSHKVSKLTILRKNDKTKLTILWKNDRIKLTILQMGDFCICIKEKYMISYYTGKTHRMEKLLF